MQSEGLSDIEKILLEGKKKDNFNERLLKIVCLNQAIGKMKKESDEMIETRDKLISSMLE
jgi:hypothetical protein